VIAFGQTDEIIAAGDHTGRILMWHGFAAAAAAVGAAAAGTAGTTAGSTGAGAPGAASKMEVGGGGGGGGGDNRVGYSLGDKIPCTTMHWHAQGVECLTFSADGAYLLSGRGLHSSTSQLNVSAFCGIWGA